MKSPSSGGATGPGWCADRRVSRAEKATHSVSRLVESPIYCADEESVRAEPRRRRW